MTVRVRQLFRVTGLSPTPPVPPVPPEHQWEVIAFGSGASLDMVTARTTTIDTTGANLIVVTAVALNLETGFIVDSFGQSAGFYEPLTRFGINLMLRSYILSAPLLSGPGYWVQFSGPGVGSPSYPAITALALHAPDPTLAIEGPTYGNTGTFPLQSLTPAMISFFDALVVTSTTEGTVSAVFTPPGGYSVITAAGVPGANFPLKTAYRVVDGPTIENPTWATDIATDGSMNLLVFNGE